MTRFPRGRKPRQPGEARKRKRPSLEEWATHFSKMASDARAHAKKAHASKPLTPTEAEEHREKVHAYFMQAKRYLETVNTERAANGLPRLSMKKLIALLKKENE